MKSFMRHCLSIALAIIVAGCATQPIPLDSLISGPASPVVFLELPPAIDLASLHRVMSRAENDQAIQDIAAEERHIGRMLDEALLWALKAQGLQAITTVKITDKANQRVGELLSGESLSSLQRTHPANRYLRVAVTDFGETPRSWMDTYILVEVTATAAVTGWLYSYKSTRPLAGIYLGQEAIEEFAEGYTGFWLLNRLSRPIRVEADLLDAKNGQVLWHESQTGMADWTWTNLWKMDDAKRDTLLQESMKKVAMKLVEKLTAR